MRTHSRGRKSTPLVKPSHLIGLMATITALGILSFLLSHDAIATLFYPAGSSAPDEREAIAEKDSSQLPLLPLLEINAGAPAIEIPASPDHWETHTVNNGDNLYTILGRLGFDPSETQKIIDAGPSAAVLKRLIPGQRLRLRFAKDELAELIYENDGINVVQLTRSGSGYELANFKRNLETRMSYASGVIDSSLFLAAQGAGLSVTLTMQLAAIFGWDIDFALDLQKGDRFTVVYEEMFSSGDKVRDGAILAAEFINGKKTHRAVRYTNTEGRADYFSPKGQNLRKAFLRTPVDVTRVSSGFGVRFHPILNRIRAHRGVDYVAPIGTPIRVTGDGKIAYRGVRSGYGKTMIVDHGNGYQTIYAHLSQFRSDLRSASLVKQGQIIGYVGNTGLATGPHLHYEFQVKGVHRDPLTVKLPSAAPIAQSDKKEFVAQTERFVELIETLDKTNLALTAH